MKIKSTRKDVWIIAHRASNTENNYVANKIPNNKILEQQSLV